MTETGYQPRPSGTKAPTPPNCGSALKQAAVLCTECLDFHLRRIKELEAEKKELESSLYHSRLVAAVGLKDSKRLKEAEEIIKELMYCTQDLYGTFNINSDLEKRIAQFEQETEQ